MLPTLYHPAPSLTVQTQTPFFVHPVCSLNGRVTMLSPCRIFLPGGLRPEKSSPFSKNRFSFQIFLWGLHCEDSKKISSGWRFKCEKWECFDSCEIGFYVMLMDTCESSWGLTLTHVMSKQFHFTISFWKFIGPHATQFHWPVSFKPRGPIRLALKLTCEGSAMNNGFSNLCPFND